MELFTQILVKTCHVSITVMENGGHWFHTEEQCSSSITGSKTNWIVKPAGLIINIILRRVLFEKVQHTGDCRLTGRFADDQNKPPAERQLQSTIFRRKNNEYK